MQRAVLAALFLYKAPDPAGAVYGHKHRFHAGEALLFQGLWGVFSPLFGGEKRFVNGLSPWLCRGSRWNRENNGRAAISLAARLFQMEKKGIPFTSRGDRAADRGNTRSWRHTSAFQPPGPATPDFRWEPAPTPRRAGDMVALPLQSIHHGLATAGNPGFLLIHGKEDELIAAHAISAWLAKAGTDFLRNRAQHGISGLMAGTVVQLMQTVGVDKDTAAPRLHAEARCGRSRSYRLRLYKPVSASRSPCHCISR